MNKSRRNLVVAAAKIPLLLTVVGAVARAADESPCVDLDSLPASQKSMRRSLGFKAASTDPKKRCGLCVFFTASASNCGTCGLLNGGAVTTSSVCDSWAAKAS